MSWLKNMFHPESGDKPKNDPTRNFFSYPPHIGTVSKSILPILGSEDCWWNLLSSNFPVGPRWMLFICPQRYLIRKKIYSACFYRFYICQFIDRFCFFSFLFTDIYICSLGICKCVRVCVCVCVCVRAQPCVLLNEYISVWLFG